MSTKLIVAALAAAISFSALAPSIAIAEDNPQTKAACEKDATMRWDDSSSTCVKR